MSLEKRIAELTFKYLQGSLSPDEEFELRQWIESSPHNESLFQKYTNREFLEESWKKDTALVERISPFQVNKPDRMRIIFFKKTWFRYAAAVMIVSGVTVLFFTSKKKSHQNSLVQVSPVKNNNDVAPGTTKAILTLADGSQIVLENNPDGKLADQGDTKILSHHGELVYNGKTNKTGEIIYNTLTTNRGQQFPLKLSDGTALWLNAASSVRFPVTFTGKERRVEITGEVYFEVAKNPNMPFKVLLNGMEITVLGTHFNVNGYTDEAGIKTTLLEGSVKITKENSTVLLIPGQQANLDKEGKINLVRDADIEKAISWKDGYFHFNNNDLETVMRELSRWYDVDIFYEQETKKSEQHFSGDIEKSLTLSAVLRVLEKSQVHFRIEGKKLIVMP